MILAPRTTGIKLRDISKSYGASKILSGLDLDVQPGEFVAMLGPSGSGKTTVLKLIAGFENPDSGSLMLGDREMSGIPPERRNIGVVFQNYSLFPHMTVADNVGFPLRMRGMSKAKSAEAIGNALEQVALTGFERRMPHQLSGGQQQRVAIARAIVFEPDVLLMDEPLGALDRRLRGDLQLEIKALHERLGVTVVYVTHDQDEALSMSDRLIVFNCGRIEQIGKPRDVYRTPKTLFVADFLGDSLSVSAKVSGRSFFVSGSTKAFDLPVGASHDGNVKLLWRSDTVAIRSAPPHPIQNGQVLVLPASVETAAYNGNAVRLRVRLSTGDTGIVLAGESEIVEAGATVGVALDLTGASVLPTDERET